MKSRTFYLVGLLASAALACAKPASTPREAAAPGGSSAAQPGAATTSTDDAEDYVDREPVTPADPAWLATTTALDPNVRRGTLPNGLTYYLVKNQEPKGRAAMWLAVNAGSVLEDEDQRGLAHFVEHMAFNGTAKFPKHAIIETIERFGMKFGADLNAYTSFDETVYQLKVPTDKPENIATAFDILREWAGNVSFDAKEVDAERGVVLEEWRLGQGAMMRLMRKQLPLLLLGSKHAERLPIGEPDILRTASRDALVRFYGDWYRPDLMAVIVAGDLDLDQAEADIKARFTSLTNPAKPRVRPTLSRTLVHATKVSRLADKELPLTVVGVADKIPAPGESTVGNYRDYLIQQLAGAMLGERFADVVKQADSPFLFPPAIVDNELARDITVIGRIAVVKPGRVLDGMTALMTENARAAKYGFRASELARAKAALRAQYEKSARELGSRESEDIASELTRHFFEGEQVPGRLGELDLLGKLLPTIGLADVNASARRLGATQGRVVTVMGKAESDLPAEADLLAAISAGEARAVRATGGAITGKLLESPPAPGAILGERTNAALGVTEWQLSNGAKVVLKPTDFEADSIYVSAVAKGGYSLADEAALWSARFADEVVAEGGVGSLSATDLSKSLAGRQAYVSTYIGELEQGLTGSSSRADLELMLQLVHAKLTAPRRDELAFASWKTARQAMLRDNDAAPEQTFYKQYANARFANNVWRRHIEASDLDAVSLDDALAFYRARFADVSGMTFVVVGNVDVVALRPLVETYLASLPGSAASPRQETWRDVKAYAVPGVHSLTVNAGTEPKSLVSISTWTLGPWSAKVEADAEILQMVLRTRLLEVLREAMSGVYGVGVYVAAQREPRSLLSLRVEFGCAPENVDALRKAVATELAAIAKRGVDQAHLVRIAAQLRRQREEDLRDNQWWRTELLGTYRMADAKPPLWDIDAVVGRVTSANVRALAKRFVAAPNTFVGVLMPVP